MIDKTIFTNVAQQMMSGVPAVVEGKRLTVSRTSSQRLRTAAFTAGGREYQAIEQNPEKASRWGELARSGHQVVQFKDAETNRFVAVAVDGKVKEYGALRSSSKEDNRYPKRKKG